jgi:hypothetical protein
VNRNRGGFDLGFGGEFRLTDPGGLFSGLSLWLEYDHIFPQDTTLFFANPFDNNAANTAATIRRDFNKVLFGLNWRFGSNGGATTQP